tara:strand:+ start:271 stop:1689 length:1419 start_codon:yes stop_codon:yes gene_type:complete
MSQDEYKIREPFKASYTFHKASKSPAARYYVYNKEGKRKARMKLLSREFEYQSAESVAEYNLWFEKTDVFSNPFVGNPSVEYTVEEVATRWFDFHKQYFSSDRHDRSFYNMVVRLLKPYFSQPANEFRSSQLIALRDELQKDAEERQHRNRDWINRHVKQIKKMFEWASARDFAGDHVCDSLNKVANLTAKQSPNLRDAEEREAADPKAIEDAILHANPTIMTMLVIQVETGLRPKELREMTWDDINTEGDKWFYTPKNHKNRSREKAKRQKSGRVIFFTEAAQNALWKYHEERPAPMSQYIFNPRECKAYNRLERHREKFTDEIIEVLHRLTRKPNLRSHYAGKSLDNPEVFTYAMAGELLGVHHKTVQKWSDDRVWEMDIERAYHLERDVNPLFGREMYLRQLDKVFKKYDIERFTPYQIRHTVAQMIDKLFGREAVAAVLGHKKLDTSGIYTKRNHALAEQVQAARSDA